MKSHGKEFVGKLIVNTGSTPVSGAQGELFYDTDDSTLYVGNGSTFDAVGSGGGGVPAREILTDESIYIIVNNGYGTCIPQDGTITIRASEYIRTVHYAGGGTLTYGMRKAGEGIGFPATGSNTDPKLVTLTYGCEELGSQIIDIWVTDGSVSSYTETYILVQNNMGYCSEEGG